MWRRPTPQRGLPRLRRRHRPRRRGRRCVRRYGNLFDMYERITGEDPYTLADAHLPRHPLHHGRTLGGLQPDDHRARPLRARRVPTSQTTAPIASAPRRSCRDSPTATSCCRTRSATISLPKLGVGAGSRPTDPVFSGGGAPRPGRPHPGQCLDTGEGHQVRWSTTTASWARSSGSTAACPATRTGLEKALSRRFRRCARSSGRNVKVLGSPAGLTINQSLEQVNRVDDFMEMAELKVRDALHREESCGGHFREEHQTPEGEALRDDENFAYVAAWDWQGPDRPQDADQGAARVRERRSSPRGATSERRQRPRLGGHRQRLGPGERTGTGRGCG